MLHTWLSFKAYLAFCIVIFLLLFFLTLYKERSDIIRNMMLIYISKEILHRTCTELKYNTNLTRIIATIGATNPHMAPFSVPIQQLYMCYTIIRYFTLHKHLHISTHKLSCPYWLWATPTEIATIGTGMPIEIHLHINNINEPTKPYPIL